MNDKLRAELDELAERILPTHQVRIPEIPDADELIRESDTHLCQATEHYRKGLGKEALGQPPTAEYLRTLIEQQAAVLAQGRATLMLMVVAMQPDEEYEEALPS